MNWQVLLLICACYLTLVINVSQCVSQIVFVWFFVGILLGGGTPSSDINLSSQWAKHWGLLSPQFLLIGNEPRFVCYTLRNIYDMCVVASSHCKLHLPLHATHTQLQRIDCINCSHYS